MQSGGHPQRAGGKEPTGGEVCGRAPEIAANAQHERGEQDDGELLHATSSFDRRYCTTTTMRPGPKEPTVARAKGGRKRALWLREGPCYRGLEEGGAMTRRLDFRLLGPLEVLDGARSLPLGGRKQRTLLAILLLHANEVVAQRHPDRRPLGRATPRRRRERRSRSTSRSCASSSPPSAWRRAAPATSCTSSPRSSTSPASSGSAPRRADSEPEAAAVTLAEALALWRGRPLADFAYDAFAQGEIARLEELRLRRDRAADRGRRSPAAGMPSSSASWRRSSPSTPCASACASS